MKEYKLIFCCYPGYSEKTEVRDWGWDLKEILQLFSNTVDLHSHNENEKLDLCLHGLHLFYCNIYMYI